MYLFSLIYLLLTIPAEETGSRLSHHLAPVLLSDRSNVKLIELTRIGAFGIVRKARPQVPEHLHTGIDIKRPTGNYRDEPIFPIASGVVISKREDGPYAQLIIEHKADGFMFWTVYEHIAEIKVGLNQSVNPFQPIARFFNTAELDQHGWQFDHFHFEVLKKRPMKIIPPGRTPHRHYHSYSLTCYTYQQLSDHFHDPISFLNTL